MIQGTFHLPVICLVGTFRSIAVRMVYLKYNQASSTFKIVGLSVFPSSCCCCCGCRVLENSTQALSISSLSLSTLARLYKMIFLGFIFGRDTFRFRSVMIQSWSLMPAYIIVFWIKAGHVVKTRSRIFDPLVGSEMCWLKELRRARSTIAWFTCIPY